MTTENIENTATATDPIAAATIDFNDSSIKAAIESAAAKIAEDSVQSATTGLVNKNKELIGEKKVVKEQLADLSSKMEAITSKYDFDSIDEQLKQAEEDKLKALSAEERHTIRMEQLTSNFTTEKNELSIKFEDTLSEKDAVISSLKGNLFNTTKGNDLKAGMSEHGGKPHLLENLLAGQTEVVEDNGKFVTRVVRDGEVRVNTSGAPMSVSELVAEFKKDEKYGACFDASGAGGGGANGNASTESSTSTTESLQRSKMSRKDKSAYVREHGQDAFMSLPI